MQRRESSSFVDERAVKRPMVNSAVPVLVRAWDELETFGFFFFWFFFFFYKELEAKLDNPSSVVNQQSTNQATQQKKLEEISQLFIKMFRTRLSQEVVDF